LAATNRVTEQLNWLTVDSFFMSCSISWMASLIDNLSGFNSFGKGGYKGGYKDGLQPESLADGNWLVKQNQPVSKIETKSDTNLRSLYES